MTWADWMWLPPLMLCISLVVGAAGSEGRAAIQRSIRVCFVGLTLGVVGVAVAIHLVARIFA